MAIFCPDLNLLFIMVPGTGCSVVGNVLARDFGGQFLPAQDIMENGKVIHQRKHNTVQQIISDGLLEPQRIKQLLVVATVRNPFDHFVTYFQRLKVTGLTIAMGSNAASSNVGKATCRNLRIALRAHDSMGTSGTCAVGSE